LLGDLAIALGFVCAGASAQGGMDGSWTGRAETSIGGGRCGQSFGLQATIAGGELAGTATRSPETFEMNGKVRSDGKLKWNVFGPGVNASGHGRVEAGRASGGWFDDTKGDCEGNFVLERAD
jgi:hypothetical protein